MSGTTDRERVRELLERVSAHHYPSERPMGPYAPAGSPKVFVSCGHYCSSWPCVEQELVEAVTALLAGLSTEGEVTNGS